MIDYPLLWLTISEMFTDLGFWLFLVFMGLAILATAGEKCGGLGNQR